MLLLGNLMFISPTASPHHTSPVQSLHHITTSSITYLQHQPCHHFINHITTSLNVFFFLKPNCISGIKVQNWVTEYNRSFVPVIPDGPMGTIPLTIRELFTAALIFRLAETSQHICTTSLIFCSNTILSLGKYGLIRVRNEFKSNPKLLRCSACHEEAVCSPSLLWITQQCALNWFSSSSLYCF